MPEEELDAVVRLEIDTAQLEAATERVRRGRAAVEEPEPREEQRSARETKKRATERKEQEQRGKTFTQKAMESEREFRRVIEAASTDPGAAAKMIGSGILGRMGTTVGKGAALAAAAYGATQVYPQTVLPFFSGVGAAFGDGVTPPVVQDIVNYLKDMSDDVREAVKRPFRDMYHGTKVGSAALMVGAEFEDALKIAEDNVSTYIRMQETNEALQKRKSALEKEFAGRFIGSFINGFGN